MQYLMQLSDEFRDTYAVINRRVDEIQDEIQVIRMKLDTIEQNTHPNRDIDEKKYNK